MKKILYFAAVAAAALTACNKEVPQAGDPDVPAQKVTMTVSIAGSDMETKAVGVKGDASDEAKVNTLQVFIFNDQAGGIVDGYGVVANATQLQIGCTAGSREVYALVNVPDLKHITKKSDLLKQISHLSNDTNDFEMIGNKTEQIAADGQEVNVNVFRFASRVVVKKITNALSSPALQTQKFTVKSVHLNNVAGDIDFAKTTGYAPTEWYNRMSYQVSNNLSLVTVDAIGADLAPNASYSTAHYLYAYPNKNAYSAAASWSPRRTMLVVKVQIGETLYDYPILLHEFDWNKSYEIDEIQITRPGNVDDGVEGGTDEQVPVEGKDCVFSVAVQPWTVVPVTEGIII